MVAQAQLGLVQPSPDGTITVPGSDGKPVKIPAAALATAAPTMLPTMAAGIFKSTFNSSPRVAKQPKNDRRRLYSLHNIVKKFQIQISYQHHSHFTFFDQQLYLS